MMNIHEKILGGNIEKNPGCAQKPWQIPRLLPWEKRDSETSWHGEGTAPGD